MENVNRLLLENVLPAHVAAHFIGDKLNEVGAGRGSVALGEEGTEGTAAGPPAEGFLAAKCFPWVLASPLRRGQWRLWSRTPGGQDPHSRGPWFSPVYTGAHSTCLAGPLRGSNVRQVFVIGQLPDAHMCSHQSC